MSLTKPRKSGLLASLVIIAVAVSVAGLAIVNRQQIVDVINYWNYHPSSVMQSFAKRSQMSGEGVFLFYSAHPSLEDKAQFNKSCPNTNPQMAILGCYDGQDIYIYNVTNAQLDGIGDVTAAYEMLHAAYKRLSTADRTRLDSLIEAEYAKQTDPAMKQLVDYFATSEPGQRDNELFSLIATQVPDISPALEEYYSRYFTDRQALVALYNKYSSVFTTLTNQSNDLANKLDALATTITASSTQYNADVDQLNADTTAFNRNASDGNFSSQSDFTTQRNALNARYNALSAERTQINNEIETYNTYLAQYNALSLQTKQLYSSINSLASSQSV